MTAGANSSSDSQAFSRLLELEPYEAHTPDMESLFMEALADAIRGHSAGNPHYEAFLARKGFSPDKPFLLQDVPFLPAQLFKLSSSSLATIPVEQQRLSLRSSATSGLPSTIPIDDVTAGRQTKCMTRIMSDFLGKKRMPFLVLDEAPQNMNANYGARGAALRGYLRFASSWEFFIRESSGQLIFMQDKFAEYVNKLDPQTPVTLFGFTYVLFGHVVRYALKHGLKFSLPSGSRLLHIGGWKKLEAEKVSRKRFSEDIEAVFDISPDKIIDVYGFTEQMGLNYPDCPCGCKHAPHLARIIARDPLTLLPLPPGRTGVLEFITPLPHSYAGAAVLTDDLGELVAGECPYGRHGQRFRVLGRLPKAEARGCGDIMGEKMRGARVEARVSHAPEDGLRIAAWGARPRTIDDLVGHCRKASPWLDSQPLELLVGLIDKVAGTWENNPGLSAWRHEGLSFLARWCSRSNLYALARASLRGMPEALDHFTPEPGRKTHFLRAKSLGLVCHWLSGNVPFLAMLALTQSVMAKNVNILKAAGNNFEVLRELLHTFSGHEYRAPDGAAISGDDFLKAISIVHFPHADQAAGAVLSGAADARVAWGGREAVDAICALPSRAEATDIVFGPKTSLMVVAREALGDDTAIKKLLRRAATDVSSFDQAACSSPHTIFVERGASITPLEFAAALGAYLERALGLIPPRPEDEARSAAVQFARAVGDFMGHCWHSQGPGWTVLYDESLELAKPVYSRTITVRPVDDIMDAAALVHNGIQTIGLAAEGSKRLLFAEAAASRGALRFPEIGAMTGFDTPWDGMFIMDRLVRWISLGGASSAIARKEA